MSEETPVHGRITNKAGKSDKPRYIRPVERQRMRPWLISHLDGDDIPGLEWQDRKEKVFRISWKHAANQCFNMQKDTNLFERWAIHTGRHFDSDHKRWKANFRCALNSLPDVVEHKDEGIKKGNNAFKVYRFLDEKETRVNKELKVRKKKEPPDVDTEEDSGYRDHSYAESDQVVAADIPRLEHFSGGLRFLDTFQTQKFRPLQGRPDDPNLQEILAAATASLAAGSDAVSLEKISIEQLSSLGELSRMRLEIRQSSPESEGHMDVYLCTWCDKVFPSKIEIFKHLLMTHQARLLSGEVYKPAEGPDVSDPKYQKLQKEIEVLEKEVFSFKPESYQATPDEVENEEIVDVTSAPDVENQALDLSVKSKGNQQAKQEVALDLSMSSLKRHKSAKTLQAKQTSKRRRSSLEIDYTVKFGNYGLAGMPRTKRQMSLHTRKKEEEEEKLAKKQSVDADSVDGASQRSAEDLVHAEILMSLQSAPDDIETSNDSTSVKIKKDTGKTKKVKSSHKKHIVNLEKVIDDVAKRGKGDGDSCSTEAVQGNSKLNLTAFRCGLCLRKFDDAAVLNRHVEEHKQVEKASPIIRLKADPIISADNPGFMYFRQKSAGNVQTIWKCQISSSSGATSVYVCGVCQMKFDSLTAINEHEKSHATKAENQDDHETVSEETIESKTKLDATADSKNNVKEKDKAVIKEESEDEKGNTGMCEESKETERMDTNKEDTSSDKGVDQEEISLTKVTGDSVEETDSGGLIETEAVKVIEDKQEDTAMAGEDIEEIMDTSEVEVATETVRSAELKGDYDVCKAEEIHNQIISDVDSGKKSQIEEIGKYFAEDFDNGNQDKALNEDKDRDKQEVTTHIKEDKQEVTTDVKVDKQEVIIDVKEEEQEVTTDVKEGTLKASTDEKEHSEKTKIVQCNVPAFLEVSAAAEGFGIKEDDEVSEESDKKNSGPEFLNCGICNKKLKLDEVKVHLENHDAEMEQSGKLSDSCIICKKMIASKDMNEHLKSHSVLELSLAKNILVHNQNQLKKQLVVHKQLVKEAEAKGENIKMFVCNLCDKGFEDCGSLSEHVEKHLSTDDEPGKCQDVLEDEGCVDAVPEVDSGTENDPKRKKRKLKSKPETDQANKSSKKAKIIGGKGDKVTDSEPLKDNTSTTKTATTVIESDPKKNSLLAAALSSAPKFAASLPKTVATKETTTSPGPVTGNIQSVVDTSNESTAVVTSTSSISTSTVSVTTTSSASTVMSSDQRSSSSSETENSALKCLKFPLVLLKPNSETEANKTEGAVSVATPAKQNNMSLPVVLVRQENQELKLVPMSSVLNICSTGKTTESSTNFLKLASPAVSTSITTKKALDETGQKPVTVTRPPILYAPVPSGKSTSGYQGYQSLTAGKIGSASPFPMNLFANQSVVGVFGGKTAEQAVTSQQKVKQVDTAVTALDGKPAASKVPGLKDGKTESQNIIAKLLDSKGKLATQKGPALIVKGKVSDESLEVKLKSAITQTEDKGTQSILKSQTMNLSGMPSVPGPRPVKLSSSEQSVSSSLPHQPVLIFKRCPTSAPPTSTPTDSSLLTKTPSDASTNVSSSVTPEKNAAQEVPAKLGRPPIHGNKAVFIHSQQVSMAMKPKISTSVTSVTASMNSLPSTQLSSASSTLVSLAAMKQQSNPTVTTTASSGVQLQPNLVSMMLQQLLLSQASQGPVTSTPTVTSPKPTFNLVFAQQSTSVQTSLPSSTSPAPSSVLTAPQQPVSSPSVTTSQSQSLILMCKACNQSLDSLGLMGSHVCPKSPTALSSMAAAATSKRKVTLYKCSFCGDITFTDYSLYAQHVKSHMDKVQKGNSRSPLLACPLCRDIFQEEESVTLHMEEKHPEGNIKCKYCDRTCVGKTDYELHVLYDHPWQCNKCFHRFSTLSQLYIHVMLDFKSVPSFTCNKCNRCFPSVESIVTHTSTTHPDSDSVLSFMNQEVMNTYMQKSKSTCSCTCKVCDAGFENTEYMMSHVQMVHFTKVIFMCGICGENKRLPTRSALKSHPHFSGSWKREIQFCYQCCLLFPNRSQFNKHLSTHQNVVTDSTKSKLKSVLKDKAKGNETDVAKHNTNDSEVSIHELDQMGERNITDPLDSNEIKNATDHTETPIDKSEHMEAESIYLDKNTDNNCDTNKDMREGRMMVGDIEVFPCHDCTAGPFKSRYQLKQHRVIKHMYPRNRTSTSYYQHVIENLRRPKVFECVQCGRRFERQNSLFCHQLSHGIKKYHCQVRGCRSVFSSTHALKAHQRKCRLDWNINEVETAKEMEDSSIEEMKEETSGKLGNFANVYLCKLCDKDCENMSDLKQHILLVHRTELHQCDICKAYFLTNKDLTSHRDAHHYTYNRNEIQLSEASGEQGMGKVIKRKLYSCSVCLKSFFKLMVLKRHLQEHKQNVKQKTSQGSGTEVTAEIAIENDGANIGAGDRTEDFTDEQDCQFMCSVCKAVFSTSQEIFQHVKIHRYESGIDTETLGKHTYSRSSKLSHLRTNSQEGEMEEVSDINKILNAVICNNCTKIVYFEEDRLCESVLNHKCAVSE